MLIVLIAATWVLIDLLPSRHKNLQYALQLPIALELPEFSLLDQSGEALTNNWFKGRWTLVFFGFTHCPDICPATLQLLSIARQRLLGAAPGAELPTILLVSVDPDRDTPKSLQAYISHFGEGFFAATGELEELQKLTSTLGIYFERETVAPDAIDQNYNVAHSAHVIVIDDRGRYSAVFGPPHNIAAFVTDLPLLMHTR